MKTTTTGQPALKPDMFKHMILPIFKAPYYTLTVGHVKNACVLLKCAPLQTLAKDPSTAP